MEEYTLGFEVCQYIECKTFKEKNNMLITRALLSNKIQHKIIMYE